MIPTLVLQPVGLAGREHKSVELALCRKARGAGATLQSQVRQSLSPLCLTPSCPRSTSQEGFCVVLALLSRGQRRCCYDDSAQGSGRQ